MAHMIVGVDGSSGAERALQWALREAAVRGTAVRAVYAWGFIDRHHRGGDHTFDPNAGLDHARDSLAEAVAAAVGSGGALVEIEQRVVNDEPVAALLAEAKGADLLVIGARGLGGFKRMVLGSVSEQCLAHARCPVAIVRETTEPRHGSAGRILVGIDGSETGQNALVWALGEARRRGSAVDVVHGWDIPTAAHMNALALDLSIYEDAAREVLGESMQEVAREADDLDVRPTIAQGHAARVLIDRSEDVDLAVVGARGIGGFAGMLLGSVSRSVAYHAQCPVVVHRSPDD